MEILGKGRQVRGTFSDDSIHDQKVIIIIEHSKSS